MKPQYKKCIVAPFFAPRWEIRSTEHEQEPMVWGFHLIWLRHSPPQHFALPFTPFLRATHESGRTHSQPAVSTSGPSPSLLNSCPWAQPQLNIYFNKGENKMHDPIISNAVIIIEYMFHQQSKNLFRGSKSPPLPYLNFILKFVRNFVLFKYLNIRAVISN